VGHAAASAIVASSKLKSGSSTGVVKIKTWGGNPTREALGCAACFYHLQVKVFRSRPDSLFLIVTGENHINASTSGARAHGPGSDHNVIRKVLSPDMRQFILAQHQDGVQADAVCSLLTAYTKVRSNRNGVHCRGPQEDCFTAEAHKKIADSHGIGHLQTEERNEEVARVALAEVAAVQRQLIRNLAKACDQEMWQLHDNEVV
jgi:hypothetical protein